MSIIHRLNSIFSYKEKKVDGAEVWMVYWNTYISNGLGMRYPEVKRLSKAFLNKEDAVEFKNNLEKALEILQSNINIGIEIEKQK